MATTKQTPVQQATNFGIGAISGMCATLCIMPFDICKVRI